MQQQLNLYETSLRTDEVKLRDFISQLKKARSSVMSTINSDLESMHNEDNVPLQNNVNDNRTADLEMAVLVQVLLHIYISNLRLICVNIKNVFKLLLCKIKYRNILIGTYGHARRKGRFKGEGLYDG